jgi:regulator of protease activity HflC (stomatin/prohibitin superfamily)
MNSRVDNKTQLLNENPDLENPPISEFKRKKTDVNIVEHMQLNTGNTPLEYVVIVLWSIFCYLCPFMWPFCIRLFKQYERCVLLRFGKLQSKVAKGPGLFFFLPGIDMWKVVVMRITTLDVPPQNTITKDNVPCSVNAVAFSFVTNPVYAIMNVKDYHGSTFNITQTRLRGVVGESTLDQLVTAREYNSNKLRSILDEATDPWGIKVCAVEISDLRLPNALQDSMANQAEKERERRAKKIKAEGELQSSANLLKAAQILNQSNAAMKLRFFETLDKIGTDQMTEIYYPLPVNIDVEQPILLSVD